MESSSQMYCIIKPQARNYRSFPTTTAPFQDKLNWNFSFSNLKFAKETGEQAY